MKKEISCLETCLDSAEFCISSCLSRMVKMEVWMRKTQDKIDGVVPEVMNLTSKDREGKQAIGDVLRSPFLDLGLLNKSEVTLGARVLGLLSLTQILDSPEAASLEEIERVVTQMVTVGFDGPVTLLIELLW